MGIHCTTYVAAISLELARKLVTANVGRAINESVDPNSLTAVPNKIVRKPREPGKSRWSSLETLMLSLTCYPSIVKQM
jgi:hypothetical protein